MDLKISKNSTFSTAVILANHYFRWICHHPYWLKLIWCLSIQYCLQFNDDIIASGSADSTVRLWSHQGMWYLYKRQESCFLNMSHKVHCVTHFVSDLALICLLYTVRAGCTSVWFPPLSSFSRARFPRVLSEKNFAGWSAVSFSRTAIVEQNVQPECARSLSRLLNNSPVSNSQLPLMKNTDLDLKKNIHKCRREGATNLKIKQYTEL